MNPTAAWAQLAILLDAGTCEVCFGPADFLDAERVQCDCGATVCSACCVAFEGESYCPDCACDHESRETGGT